MQAVDDIKPCYPLFRDDDYKENLKRKQDLYEERVPADKVLETFEWTTSKEYQDINFKREAITINPAKACQPLGAVLCSLGFKNTMPYVHGSQGCVAYFRTYFNRHFKEPVSCVSDSMTEDAAVFGGQKNMFDGLENAKAIYKPDMIAVSTTCMAEVIGDDLNAFINNAKKAGHVPQEYPVPFAHTPSFVGSHTTGWDNMFEGIARFFTLNKMEGKVIGSNGKLNFVPGFETYLGNYRVIKRMMGQMGVDATCCPTRATSSIPRPTASSACTPAAPPWTRSAMRRTRSTRCSSSRGSRTSRRSSPRPCGTTTCPSSTFRWAWTGPTSS